MTSSWRALLAALLALALLVPAAGARDPAIPEVALRDLPREARQTIVLIHKGGPYPYERDGIAFGNFEKRLPVRERGYYREYTVPTPGARHRGARRIIAGRGGEFFYTDDHYNSFKWIRE